LAGAARVRGGRNGLDAIVRGGSCSRAAYERYHAGGRTRCRCAARARVFVTRAAVLIPAAGAGRRMGGAHKPMLELRGEPLLLHTLRPFLQTAGIEQVIVALPADVAANPPGWLTSLDPRIQVVAGGAERGDSVHAALVATDRAIDVVLVHDAARPLVTTELIERAMAAAAQGRNVIAAVPPADTIQQVDADDRI